MRQFLGVNDGSNSLPLRTNLLHIGTDSSSTEDFRGVIDDLTIENKKLKRRLKKYEKLHDSHLRDEKLFEVRIHGLPPEKKRELEETLRKFASSLGNNGFPSNGYEGLLPVLNSHKTASSQTSLQNTDSAYASMSGSGQGSAAQSGGESRHKQTGMNTASRRQNIHSYLHHIPEGLLPQPSPANMTESAKKKLVVRRLEQIFAGKGATLGGHQHPLQQQEVSQMAARADRAESEAQGQRSNREGTREAHIMSQRAGEANEALEGSKQEENNTSPDEDSSNTQREKAPALVSKASYQASKGTGEQRPTRPLDLDPYRAQVPADNIRYMRHLGFSPPDPESLRSPEEGHGWVYLNLLINMAQLHTINVTADFVRKALSERSSKFELSHDGRKVRWKGGKSVTRTSSSGGGSSNERTDVDTPDRASPRKKPKLSHRESHRSGGSYAQAGASKSARAQPENSKLMYTPLFFHKDSTDEADDSSEEEDSESSPYPAPGAGDSSGMTSSGIRTTSTKRKRQDDGPIIFYNNARFCTDLSGDRKATGNTNAPPYTTATSTPVGQPQKPIANSSSYEKRGPLAEATELPEPMDIGDNPIPDSMELAFPPRSPLKSQTKDKVVPIEMEVTGIGGVWPADNFAIAVESRHARLDQSTAPSVDNDLPNKRLPEKFARILKESGPDHRVRAAMHKQEIVATKTNELPPSQLPPALGFPFGEDSTGDDESDIDDEMSVSPESPHALPPSAAPQPVELHYTSSDEGEEEDDEDDDSDDGSLDLLASARQINPEAIREQEREYDANMAERLAEEIPAGSSAATAGGGSGFASPASASGGVNRDEYQRAVKEARARPADLKRSKTSDSMKVQNPAKSSDGDSDEEMEE